MTRRVDITSSQGANVTDVFIDVDFEVEADSDYGDVLSQLIREHLAAKAELSAGKYNVRMLCVLTDTD